MAEFENLEKVRGEFQYDEVVNLTGRPELYFSPNRRNFRIAISFTKVLLFCFLVIGTTASIYKVRNVLAAIDAEWNSNASIVASVLNALQVTVYGYIYGLMAEALTDNENHR